MNEMENLYEEFRKLRDEVLSKNYEVEGAFELRKYKRRFLDFHRKNLELQEKMRSSDVDMEELRQVLNLGDRMWYELGEVLNPMNNVIDAKMSLAKQMADERIHIETLLEENLATLKTLENRLKRDKKKSEAASDPNLKAILDEKIQEDEEYIQRLKDLNDTYRKRYKELGEIMMMATVKGGIIPSLKDTLDDTDGLTDEEADKKTKEMEDLASKELPENKDEDYETKTDSKPDIEPEVDPVVASTDAPVVAPEPTETSDTKEDKPEESTDGIDPITPIVPTATEPEPASDKLEDVPSFPEEDTDKVSEEKELPIPNLLDDSSTTPEEPERPETVETEEDDLPHRATVKQPKTKLWQKVQNVLKAAGVFLLGAIAVHTGIIVHNNNKNVDKSNTDEVEETSTPTVTPTAAPEAAPEATPEATPAPTAAPEATPAPTAAPASAPEATPAPTAVPEAAPEATPAPTAAPTAATPAPTAATPAPTVAPTTTPEPTAAPTVAPVETNNVILTPGESVYNAETGVEVGYNGNSAIQTNEGFLSQHNRVLESVGENKVAVKEGDLMPDQQLPNQALPRTGMEVSEEVAKQGMTAGEKQNLEDATKEVDWESFWNEGPSLQ